MYIFAEMQGKTPLDKCCNCL